MSSPPDLSDAQARTVAGGGDARGDPATPLPPAIGPYRVIERLGRGGMGEVFGVIDPLLTRDLALKRLASLPIHPAIEGCFASELRITASLNHPSIVPIYDAGDHGPTGRSTRCR